MGRRIAIVEDDPGIRANYSDALTRHGYEVSAYANRRDAEAAFSTRVPELAIIDIGLGTEVDGGFELCRRLRGLSSTVPIVSLTARDSDFDVVSGLRLGADDYLTKDVSLPHLLARIAALFRRVDALTALPVAEDVVARGALTLDLKRMTARWNDAPVELTVTDRVVDLIEEGADLGIRLGTLVDSTLVARRICEVEPNLAFVVTGGAEPLVAFVLRYSTPGTSSRI